MRYPVSCSVTTYKNHGYIKIEEFEINDINLKQSISLLPFILKRVPFILSYHAFLTSASLRKSADALSALAIPLAKCWYDRLNQEQ